MVMDESNCPLLGYNFDTSTYSLVDGPTRCAECQGLHTRSTPDQQAIDDVKLLRASLLAGGCYCVPADDTQSDCCSSCILKIEALAATDRPEYTEEG